MEATVVKVSRDRAEADIVAEAISNITSEANIDKEARTEKEADIVSDPGTETTEDKAVLAQPESPPFVTQFPFGKKQRGCPDEQLGRIQLKIDTQSRKIKVLKGKLERRDTTISDLKKRLLVGGDREKMKGLEAKTVSQQQQILRLKSENKNIHDELTNVKMEYVEKVRETRGLNGKINEYKLQVRQLKADMKKAGKDTSPRVIDSEVMFNMKEKAEKKLKAAQTVREQIYMRVCPSIKQ